MTTENVTRDELTAHIEPMKEDIAEIKVAVGPIQAILLETQATNSTVAEHTKDISTLKQWMWMLRGGGIVVAFILGAGGVTYILTEVI